MNITGPSAKHDGQGAIRLQNDRSDLGDVGLSDIATVVRPKHELGHDLTFPGSSAVERGIMNFVMRPATKPGSIVQILHVLRAPPVCGDGHRDNPQTLGAFHRDGRGGFLVSAARQERWC